MRHLTKRELFSEPGTPGYAVETARAVSNLIQFAKAQNIPQKITDVYVAGLSDEDCLVYEDSIAQINPDLGVENWKAANILHMPRPMTHISALPILRWPLAEC